MSYSAAIQSMNAPAMIGTILGGLGLTLGSYWVPGTSAISLTLFGTAFAGLIATLGATVIYCTWVLELYLATYVLIFYLPACYLRALIIGL